MPAVALDQAGPFPELGEAGLQVGLEGEEGWEGVGAWVGEWFGGEGLHGGHVGSFWIVEFRRATMMFRYQPYVDYIYCIDTLMDAKIKSFTSQSELHFGKAPASSIDIGYHPVFT